MAAWIVGGISYGVVDWDSWENTFNLKRVKDEATD